MNKYFPAFYTCFLITCITVNAQSSREIYDQYHAWAKNSKEDTNRVLRSLEFARKLNYPAHDTALSIVKRAK
ncbi:MAG TPA: hypothetical protein VHS53_00335, partial [Mucilaginibacter sp.]|nr:hypothetical protein [Mucilaginibacter sp.]